jgi:microcystin-dependent protein
MPSANGVYSLPVGYLATTGATILASQHNPPLEDIATALTGRLSRDGTAPMTGPLALAAGTAAAPSVGFATAPTTGVYPTTGGLGVAVAGVKVAEFTAAGLAFGGRFIGEIIAFSGNRVLPPLCVWMYGQTLSRATYADLWTFAQVEIAFGNTFYNNGNGTTTFGVADLRGRVIANMDVINTTAGRLTTAGSNVNGAVLGSVGGGQNHALTLGELPTGITSANAAQAISVTSVFTNVINGNLNGGVVSGAGTLAAPVTVTAGATAIVSTGNNSIAVASNNTGGSAHALVQPTMVCIYVLFAGA